MSTSRGACKRKQPTVLACVGTGCEYPDLSTSSYAQLKSDTSSPTPTGTCLHLMCFMCFGGAVAARSANLRLSCPCETCTFTSRSWDNYVQPLSFTSQRTKSGTTTGRQIQDGESDTVLFQPWQRMAQGQGSSHGLCPR
jgi:hypothetical protein